MRDHACLTDLEIVHVARHYTPSIGGVEEFVSNLAAQQRRVFKKVRVVSSNRLPGSQNERLPSQETIDGIRVDRLSYLGTSRYPVMPGLFNAIGSADIVHVHGIDFAFDVLAASRWFHRKPLFATTHGGFFHTRTFALLKIIWFNSLTRLSASAYQAIVCCSESDRETFAKVAPANARLIANGVDIEKFSGAASSQPVKRAVTIGRFSKNKRLDLLLDLFAQLKPHDPDWTLVIFGVPCDMSVCDLERMISERDLAQTVTLRVGLPATAIRYELQYASYFLSASEYEGFGLGLIEAMSAGLIPLVHLNEAYRSLASKHPQISLSNFSNATRVAQDLENLHACASQKYLRYQENIMQEVSNYSWERAAGEYFDLYKTYLPAVTRRADPKG